MTDDDIDPSVASVASVGHTWRSALLLRSGGMSECLSSGTQHNYPAARRVSSLGTPLRLGITHRGIDWLDIQSRLYAPSDGVHRGGLARRRCRFCGRLPHTVGFASSQR